ncbi:MAG: DUF3368 domain-containing protein [Bryobacteraceae bacterium]
MARILGKKPCSVPGWFYNPSPAFPATDELVPFETTGTLGILDLAAKRKLIDLRDAIERLKRTNFLYRKDLAGAA